MNSLLKKIQICSLALFLFLTGSYCVAQIKTVIPANKIDNIILTKDNTVELNFALNTLPANSTVRSCVLQMTVLDSVQHAVVMNLKTPAGEKLNSIQLKTNFGAKTIIDINIGRSMPSSGTAPYKLLLTTPARVDRTSKFYPSTDSISPRQGYAPKLIITDTLPEARPGPEWASIHADQQHSAQSRIDFRGADVEGFAFFKGAAPFTEIRQNMVIYNDNVYVISDGDVWAVDAASLIATHLSTGFNPGSSSSGPAVDMFGRLYYPSDNAVSIVELANGNKPHKDALNIGQEIKNALTLGADGSLYVATKDAIIAYSTYPQNRVTWAAILPGAKKSSVTLNSDASRAYVVSNDNGNNVITCFDANNGKVLNSLPVAMKIDQLSFIPAPVVDENGNVYLINKLNNADELHIYNAALTTHTSVTGENISMPAAGKSGETFGVYYLKNNQLFKYIAGGETALEKLPDATGNVISFLTDKNNNIYVLASNGIFYRKGADGSTFRKYPFGEVTPVKNMAIGADGSLYSSSQREIMVARPSFGASDYLITGSQSANFDLLTFRAANLTVDGEFSFIANKTLLGTNSVTFGVKAPDGSVKTTSISKGANVTVKIRKNAAGVKFMPGFKVENGAVLSVKTGY